MSDNIRSLPEEGSAEGPGPEIRSGGGRTDFRREGERVLEATEELLSLDRSKTRRAVPVEEVDPVAAARFMAERRPMMARAPHLSQLQKESMREISDAAGEEPV